MSKIYFDYAATTPVDPRVRAAMEPYFLEKFGNAASVHQFGQEASRAVFRARDAVAKAIGAKYDQVIFTGSATEANNLALRGVVKRIMNNELRIKNKDGIIHNSKFFIPRIIVSAIEHPSILETVRDLERDGVEVAYLPVSRDGIVNLKKLKAALNDRTVLVSVMYVNNEIGTTQPISEIARIVRDFREELRIKNKESRGNPKFIIHNSLFPFLHTDAVQAFQYLDCHVDKLGVDLMTLSAHKIYGPKGIGALYVRNLEIKKLRNLQKFSNSQFHNFLSPIITGGEQEPRGLHSGTQNTPAIVGFGKAAEIALRLRSKEGRRVRRLRDYCWRKIKQTIPGARLNGSFKYRTPNNLNLYFSGVPAAEAMIKLDLEGIAVSSGSACSVGAAEPSHVLRALRFSKSRCLESLRISFGRQTAMKQIGVFVRILKKIINKPHHT